MNINVETIIQLRQVDVVTGKVVSETKPEKNLVMDIGLNALARSTNATSPAEMSVACRVGSGSTSDKIASGAITFTQVGTTITASVGFFTSAMVGYIFKYGTGTAGAEYYITAFTNSTTVTVDTSATVATPTVATVWNVIRIAMETLLYSSSTYLTTAGACGTTFTANTASHKRTYNFAQQVASYNVNEVGYFNSTTGTAIHGRLVLGSTEVVAPTNFLQVVLTIVVTYSPGVPTAVGNVGTNIDTTGNAMLECCNSTFFGTVASDGTTTLPAQGWAVDSAGGRNAQLNLQIASYTQHSVTSATTLSVTTLVVVQVGWVYASARGKMTATTNTSITTAAQTLSGVSLGGGGGSNAVCFDIQFTTPFTLPTGTFLPQVVFSCTYKRLLNN